MLDLVAWPFPLPPDFLARVGYERAIAAPAEVTDELRDQLRRQYGPAGLAAFEASVAARRPRRWVALFWEPAGDELGWTDGQTGGGGPRPLSRSRGATRRPGPGC